MNRPTDQAPLDWHAMRQNETMIEQYAEPTTPEEDAEYAAWERIRDAANADMLSRPPGEG